MCVEFTPFHKMASSCINTLRRFGERSEANKQLLTTWLDEAIKSAASNQGGQVSSASANGASYSLRPDGMSNMDWASCLDQALLLIENGLKSTSVSFGSVN